MGRARRLSLRRPAQEGEKLTGGNEGDPAVRAEAGQVWVAADDVLGVAFDGRCQELVIARVAAYLDLPASRHHEGGGLEEEEQIFGLAISEEPKTANLRRKHDPLHLGKNVMGEDGEELSFDPCIQDTGRMPGR